MRKKKIFCFDIDNIICDNKNSDYLNSKPIKKNIQIINSLKKKGHIIKIYTARFMGRNSDDVKKSTIQAKTLTLKQLKKWGVKYDNVFFGKPSADFYIDDKFIDFSLKWIKSINKFL